VAGELDLKRVERRRTWEEVVHQIEAQILQGRLRPGDRLPGERQLAEQLGVSRASVREALRVLEALEFIRARTGTGATSGSIVVHEPTAGGAMTSLLRLHIALSHFTMPNVVETRAVIEAWAARMAARRAGAAELDRLAGVLKRMEDPSLSRWDFNELDTEFHVGVAEASENGLVTYFMHAIRDAIRHEMVAAFDRVDDWRRVADTLRREHAAVYHAISVRDEESAARTVENHIRAFYFHNVSPADGQESTFHI
jgi:GntR family transcriptional regulator, transcriptional repressor for pyruvate dehydrogenase complex